MTRPGSSSTPMCSSPQSPRARVFPPACLPATGEPITEDLDDDFLVTLTEGSGADALVSGDPHLTGLHRRGLTVLTPRAALDAVDVG